MRGRLGTALVAVSLLAATGAGCGGGADGPSADEVIDVFGPYRGVEADRFVATLAGFTDATGIEVRYTGVADFVSDLEERVGEGNDPPDVAIVSQPGLVRELATEGALVPLDAATQEALAATYDEAVARLGVVGSQQYGVPFRVSIKSLVWYRPSVFADRGWEVPSTLDELEDLVAAVADDGELDPWCFTMEAGTSTGWAATDWVEDLVVRESGLDAYDAWAEGDLPFASPEVTSAHDRFDDLVLARGRLAGGRSTAVQVPVTDGDDRLFADPPGCALYKQASFALSWMPDGTTVGPEGDVDWFVLPGTDPGPPAPLVVGGDQAVQMDDRPGVARLMAYLAGPDAGQGWARAGGFLSPKATFTPEDYGTGVDRELAALLAGSPVLAFDASDRMPPSIGSGLLWTDITDWVAGALPLEDLTAQVDEAWVALGAGGDPRSATTSAPDGGPRATTTAPGG